MARFTDKVVIVTGAASGIGEAIARWFAAEGATLVLGDRNAGGLQRVATSLTSTKVKTFVGDVSAMKTAKLWRLSHWSVSNASMC